MAKNYGHIYTKNSTGTIDKFVPVLDSSQINHGNDNVENVLNDTVKSVSVEVVDKITTISTTIPSSGENDTYNSAYFTAKTALNFNNYYDNETSYYEDSLSTNQLYNVYSNITIDSLQNGFCFFFMPDANNNNLAYYVMSSYSGITSNYSGTDGLLSTSELPTTLNETKDFYVNAVWNGSSFSQYTQNDIKFTIKCTDYYPETTTPSSYLLAMIYTKSFEPVTIETEVISKELKTTVTKNDDTEVVTTSPISGILQDMSASSEQKLDNAKIYDINAHIEIWTAST